MSIFIDTGVFFGAFNTDNALHRDAKSIYIAAFKGKWGGVYTSDYIIDETCTLLKLRADASLSVQFLKAVKESSMYTVKVDDELFEKTCAIFEEKPGISFTDASTIAIFQELEIDALASFDKIFDGITKRIGEGFWASLTKDEKKKLKIEG